MPEEKEAPTRGWFRHRRSGQVFEADGYQYAEATKNRDLEAVDAPGDEDESPSAKLVALRERVKSLGLTWAENDSEDLLNRKLDELTVTLREQATALKIRHMPNWKPETLSEKIKAATEKQGKSEK